eukprot:CAMPEP_0195083600 /NCGR_PEP_ID=MMETSP0448-20130528/24498_1 /TAXON_ID=66468 /ORGANISM="Heterocapsa triquestra, Strain CCMP 448" /LENGTH=72 /DNA_ID=CAMNT_0040116827 /DNA_START=34 /DNA_END=249 /DNA_ORIENTATION=+
MRRSCKDTPGGTCVLQNLGAQASQPRTKPQNLLISSRKADQTELLNWLLALIVLWSQLGHLMTWKHECSVHL